MEKRHHKPEAPNFKAMAELRYQIRCFLRFSENAARQAGIEPQQHQLLLAVKGLPHGSKPTIGVLAERMQLQPHSTVGLIDRLAERGFLLRLRATDDRRQVLIKLTHDGEKFLQRLASHHLQELQSVGPKFKNVLQRLLDDPLETHPEKAILGGLAVGVFLIIWELVGNVFQWIDPMFMSSPSLIFKAAVQLFVSGEIYHDLYVSGIEFLGGYFLAVAVAIPFGIMVGWYKRMSYIFDPFIIAMNATPRVALLPLVIIWLGIGILSKVGIIFLGAVFSILINTRDGVKTTPVNLLNAARSFGASEWMVFKTVVVPSMIPFIVTGLRLGVGRALVGVLVGELYAATAGIGFMITVAGATFQTDKVFVGVLIFAISGMIGMELLTKLERRFDKWRPQVGS